MVFRVLCVSAGPAQHIFGQVGFCREAKIKNAPGRVAIQNNLDKTVAQAANAVIQDKVLIDAPVPPRPMGGCGVLRLCSSG